MNEYDPDVFMKQIQYSLTGKDADTANWQEHAFTSLRKKCEYLIDVLGYQSWSNPMKCPFCNPVADDIVAKNDLCYARWDRYPVSKGHLLVIPFRHTADYFSR